MSHLHLKFDENPNTKIVANIPQIFCTNTAVSDIHTDGSSK